MCALGCTKSGVALLPSHCPCPHLWLWVVCPDPEVRSCLPAVMSAAPDTYPKPEPLATEVEPGPAWQGSEKVSALTATCFCWGLCQMPVGIAISCGATCQSHSWWPAIRVTHQAGKFQELLSTHSKWELLQNQVLQSNYTSQFDMSIWSLKLYLACGALRGRLPAS